jgi:hypothetical protein
VQQLKMKGNQYIVVVLISVVMLVFFIGTATGILNKAFGDKGLVEKFSKPLLWSSEELMKVGMNKYIKQNQDYIDKVNQIFSGDPIEARCSEWYKDCGGAVSGLWNHKPDLTESDFEKANMLCNDKKSDAREKIRESWSNSEPSFKDLTGEQQYSMMKNACAVNLLNQIHEAEQIRGQS